MSRRAVACLSILALTLVCPLPSHAQVMADDAPTRLWGSAEYLLWFSQRASLPPLVTTGPLDVVGSLGLPGVLGQPGTQTLIGGPVGFGTSSGGRFTVGGWLGEEATFGAEGSYLFLARQSAGRTVSEPGTPGSRALSLPFRDAQEGFAETATGIAFPRDFAGFSGAARLDLTTQLQSWEATGVLRLASSGILRADLLAGYRYLRLDEVLAFTTGSVSAPPLPPDIFTTSDRFATRNTFNGGQLGARVELAPGPFLVRATAKVALGSMHQTTRIDGELLTNDFNDLGTVQRFAGGYFSQPTSIGRHSRDRFAVVPEVGLTCGWEPIQGVRLTAGYTFLYLSSVARPGDQIDRAINPSQNPSFLGVIGPLVGPARPAYLGRDSDFTAHGVSFGLELLF